MLTSALLKPTFARCVVRSKQLLCLTLNQHAKCRNYLLYTSFNSTAVRLFATCIRKINVGAAVDRITSKFKSISKLQLQQKCYYHPEYTNIKNNVFLYKYDTKLFTYLQLFSIVQLLCWAAIGEAAYTSRIWTLLKEKITWKQYMYEVGYRCLGFGLSVTMAPMVFAALWFMRGRCVKYIILHKGGENITVVTQSAIKSKNSITVPVENLKNRFSSGEYNTMLTIMVDGKKKHYLLDNQGKYMNMKLFEHTIGVRKKW